MAGMGERWMLVSSPTGQARLPGCSRPDGSAMAKALPNSAEDGSHPHRRGGAVPERRSPGFDELVRRPQLVRRLIAARSASLALVVAPAGYGKTSLLVEWDDRDERPFAWLALDDADNDPLRLIRSLVPTLGAVTSVRQELLDAIAADADRDPAGARARLRRAVRESRRPFVLVLDDAQVLHAPEALELVGALIVDLGPGSQIAMASRTRLDLPVGRLRAHRKLIEIRPADLGMTRSQAALLTRLAGVELDPDQLRDLVAHTEGWPAGLYLAALAAREETDPDRALAHFAGDDRHVADYLREELLDGLRPGDVEFLARSALLERLSGPLCDFVLERHDSARVLRRLSRTNLLLEPIDRTDTHYRYHRLFAEMLRGELRHREPEQERMLHGRASDWYAHHGGTALAIDHAVAAGDVRRAGDLLWEHASEFVAYGRNDAVRRWLARFSDEQIAGCPPLALTAAASRLATGNGTAAERWASAASSALGDAPSGAFEGAALLVSAVGAREGIVRMGEEAARAYEQVPDGSWWRAVARLLEGASAHLAGRREHARACLEEGARRGAATAPGIQVVCLAQLVLLAIEREDWGGAEVLAARARAQVERIGLGDCPPSALVHAASAEVLARLGRVEESQRDVQAASALLVRLSDFAPWYDDECRIATARAALRLSDAPRARQLLAGASWCRQPASGATVAREWLDDAWAQLELAVDCRGNGGWSLTTAELRVLQLLPTHLSFPEIAGRLYVSANTVKTHARAVYRKLDASSRGEAVVRARETGLLDS